MRKYDIYHSDKNGNSIMAASRTRKESALQVAEKVILKPGERISVLQDMGDMPGDFRRIYNRTN